MNNYASLPAGIAVVAALLALSCAGCGHSQPESGLGANGAASPPVSNLTPQQQQATQEAQQREAAARGTADRQQQSKTR